MVAVFFVASAIAIISTILVITRKDAVHALLLRYYIETNAVGSRSLFRLLAVLSIASMTRGNFLALLQNSVKRVLAYSSMANLGYLLVAFLAGLMVAVLAVLLIWLRIYPSSLLRLF
jgi:NADH-quinone oxidoreductase subunit N